MKGSPMPAPTAVSQHADAAALGSSVPEWRIVHSPTGDGVLFVAQDGTELRAVVPPGHLLPNEWTRGADGWRLAIWSARDEGAPALDVDPPTAVESIDTAAVLRVLPANLHRSVAEVLHGQLRSCDQLRASAVVASIAAADVAQKWLRAELSSGFGEHVVTAKPFESPQRIERVVACGLLRATGSRVRPACGRQGIYLVLAVRLAAIILKRPARDIRIVNAQVQGAPDDSEARLALLI